MRSKDYHLLDCAQVQARLQRPPDFQTTHPETGTRRALYDGPNTAITARGVTCRVIVATHPATPTPASVGTTREGVVYELFFTALPQGAFTAADVVELYLHRGAFEPALADEDQEQEPDRWCSHAPWGQEAWQIVCQWVWNLRLELGHHLLLEPLRTTEFASARPVANEARALQAGYGSPQAAVAWKAGRFTGEAFPLQSDGTLRCPAGKVLHPSEQRPEADGSLRMVYAARIADCRACPLREQCQWHGKKTTRPRRVSLVFPRLRVGSAPVLLRDWSRRQHRRACMQLLRRQRVEG